MLLKTSKLKLPEIHPAYIPANRIFIFGGFFGIPLKKDDPSKEHIPTVFFHSLYEAFSNFLTVLKQKEDIYFLNAEVNGSSINPNIKNLSITEILYELHSLYAFISLEDHVQACINLLNSDIKVLLITENQIPTEDTNEVKSSIFMLRLLKMISIITNKPMPTIISIGDFKKENYEAVAILDDVSYSGLQLQNFISQLPNNLNIHIFLAGMTQIALKNMNPNKIIYTNYNRQIKVLNELPKNIYDFIFLFLKWFDSTIELPNKNNYMGEALAFTDRKIPDHFSIFNPLMPFLRNRYKDYTLPSGEALAGIIRELCNVEK